MSSIRVTYSGLISFLIGFISLITGLVFTVIFTRSLSPEEFGTWGIIGTLTGYVILTNPLISYWVTREIARGEESGKTAIQTSFLFSVIAIIIYIGIAFFFSSQTEIGSIFIIFCNTSYSNPVFS